MRTLDPGHTYLLDVVDRDPDFAPMEGHVLRFVKQINQPEENYGGTTTQEVLRALIDRFKHLNATEHHTSNTQSIVQLRSVLMSIELRAAVSRYDMEGFMRAQKEGTDVEDLPTCPTCNHIGCAQHL